MPQDRERRIGERAVAFIDLLGFRSHVLNDTEGALEPIKNYNGWASDYLGDVEKGDLAPDIEYLLPMSDSIFFVARDCDRLVSLLASFLNDCFMFDAHFKNSPDDWPRALFRGGLSYGECLTIGQIGIHKGKRSGLPSYNLLGPAVLDAVHAEGQGKGPRLFCSREFASRLSTAKRLISESGPMLEVLWPCVSIIDDHGAVDRSKLLGYFETAARFFEFYRGKGCEEHYRQFLRLVGRCAEHGRDDEAIEALRARARDRGMESLVFDA